MTPEKQRIAIAVESKNFRDGWTQDGLIVGHRMWDGSIKNIPDYPDDLNAIHDAVLSRSHEIGCEYTAQLRIIVVRDATDDMTHNGKMIMDVFFYCATAAQCCEAYLRAIGKWEESQ